MKDFVNYCCKALKIKRPKFYFKNDLGFSNGYYCDGVVVVSKKARNIYETIAHELVHHMQYESGILKRRGVKYYWKKNRICDDTKGYEIYREIGNEDTYWNAPHEIQARDKARSLLKKWECL